MSFFLTHRLGHQESNPSVDDFPSLLAETLDDPDDQEHVNCSVQHESGWDIGAYGNGHIVFENVEELDVEPRHMRNVSDRKIIEFWTLLAHGKIEELERLPWLTGYGS